jgi:glycosyltransferase involved in cell wall biosynthesis
MRILFVTAIFPPDHGGPASYVPAMAKALGERNHDIVAVVTLSDALEEDDGDFDFPVVRLPRALNRFLRMLSTVTTIYRLSKSADVVYLNGLVLEGIVACKVLATRPVVVKVVGDLIWEKWRNKVHYASDLDTFQSQRLPLKWTLLRAVQSWYTAKADAVITPSRYLAGVVAGWNVPQARVHVVYNAVPRSEATAPRLSREAFDLVTAARLVPWKGIAELIELAKQANWSLKIIGDGPLRSDLQRLAAQAGVTGPRIVFTGHIPHESVASELSSAAVFVLNSSYEGLPHIVLEAMVMGLPVVATGAGGTPEVVNHGTDGFLVPVGNKAALRERLSELLSDRELRFRFGNAGRRNVQRRFSFETMVRDTEAVLDACAAS